MHLHVASGTDAGRERDHNEDAVFTYLPARTTTYARRGALFAVADGMGGGPKGERASRLAVTEAARAYYEAQENPTPEHLLQAVKAANRAVYHEASQEPDARGMATTVVCAVLTDRRLIVAHVGDSRAYLVRDGQARQLTRDHSRVAEMVARGILTEEEAENHPERSVITRAIGSKPEVDVDVMEVIPRGGDCFVLCSDGLSSLVSSADIGRHVESYPPRQAVTRLIALANARGGDDNISVVIIAILRVPGEALSLRYLTRISARPARVSAITALVIGLLACLGVLAGRWPVHSLRALPPEKMTTMPGILDALPRENELAILTSTHLVQWRPRQSATSIELPENVGTPLCLLHGTWNEIVLLMGAPVSLFVSQTGVSDQHIISWKPISFSGYPMTPTTAVSVAQTVVFYDRGWLKWFIYRPAGAGLTPQGQCRLPVEMTTDVRLRVVDDRLIVITRGHGWECDAFTPARAIPVQGVIDVADGPRDEWYALTDTGIWRFSKDTLVERCPLPRDIRNPERVLFMGKSVILITQQTGEVWRFTLDTNVKTICRSRWFTTKENTR